MGKLYRVVITEIDTENGTETVELDDQYMGLTLVADCADGERMSEIVLHDNVLNMANKLAAGSKTHKAVKLAAMMMDMKKDDAADAESALLRRIMGE